MLQVAYLLHGVVTCLTKETIWRGSEQISSFIPFILVDERRTEAYGLQNKVTLVNDFFLLNDCLTIKKKKKRQVEWETIVLTHCGVWSAPSPAGFAGLGESGWLPDVPEGSLQACCFSGFSGILWSLLYPRCLVPGVILLEKLREFKEYEILCPFSCPDFTFDFTEYSS